MKLLLLALAAAPALAAPLEYTCRFSATDPVVDGDLSDPAWKAAPWTADFTDIRGSGHPAPRYKTRARMLWTPRGLHVCAELRDPHVWGSLTRRNSIIFHDNDFEIFLDPDGDTLNYYEFEINALGTLWELTLDKPYSRGGKATHGTNLPGLKSAVKVHGTLNQPADTDHSWTVEVFLPWKDLARHRGRSACPPAPGDVWRINFSRVQWRHEVRESRYVRIPPHGAKIPQGSHPEDNWVWSPQGEINMHLPERWGRLRFLGPQQQR